MKLNRRRFLLGAGGAAISLPFLTTPLGKAYAQTMGGPRRLILMAYPMGTVNSRFQPTATGSNFSLPFLSEPLAPFQDRCLWISNTDNEVMHLNSQHAFGHPAKKESALTGTLMTTAFGGDGSNRVENVIDNLDGSDEGPPNNESVCNYIGTRIRSDTHTRPSVDLGINGEPSRHETDTQSSFYFEGPANPVTMQSDPARAWNDIFGGVEVDPDADAERRRRVRNKSVLDAVRGSFTDLRQGLSVRDRGILDAHADRIRQIEIDLVRAECTPPSGIPGAGSADPDWGPYSGLSMTELCDLQTRILVQAMACDMAPVGRLEFFNQQGPVFGVPSVDQAQAAWRAIEEHMSWHAMVHGDVSPVDQVPTRDADNDTYSDFLLDGYRFFTQRFANLLSELDSVPDGPDGQTMLDTSTVVLVTDYGNGNGHSANKLNYLLAGNLGTARTGFHFDAAPGQGFYADSDYNTNHVLVSLIHMFGMTNVNEFGLEGFAQGPIDHIFG